MPTLNPTPQRRSPADLPSGAGPIPDSEIAVVRMLARHLRRSVHRGVELGDLESWGTEGLLRARRRFRPERGVPFPAFARPHIRGAMLDGLRRSSPVPSGLRRVEREAQQRGRGIEHEDSATLALRERVSERRGALAGAAQVGLADRIGIADDGRPEVVAREPGPETGAARLELRAILGEALHELDPLAARVLTRHAAGDESLEEIARSLSISPGRASRLYHNARRQLRLRLRDVARAWTRPA